MDKKWSWPQTNPPFCCSNQDSNSKEDPKLLNDLYIAQILSKILGLGENYFGGI